MLYPKNSQPLTPEMFQNPSCEYRGMPFWAWNNKLDPEELTWQIGELKKMGFGGFHMHVRTGMATEYLSDEYMESVRACVEKARTEDMLAWLYDEDRWPSGAAGGLVTRQQQYRARYLLFTRTPYGEAGDIEDMRIEAARAKRAENGRLIACFDVCLDDNGNLLSYKPIGEAEAPKGFKLYAYEETTTPSPWYNNQTYVNTLDPAAIAEFIRITYDRYNEKISEDFGGIVPAIFTDEPQFMHKETLSYAHENKDITLPWTTDLPETYQAAYGDSLIEHLPELLWDLPDGEISRARYCYHDHIAERFAAAFADQCGSWCADHGLMLTGHMMEEPSLGSQTAALGEAMRSYRSFQLPGIDMLCDSREYTTAKQAQSAARQYGRPGVLSELYGVTNWDFDFRGHKLQGDWQAALGVTVRVPHLSWVSMNGEAKRDYPSTFNYQSPWYKEYPYIEDHFARVNTVMTRGKAVCRAGVLHPVESYWLHWGTRESTASTREQMEQNFKNLTEWLLRGLIDFDYICESLLPEQCDVSGISRDGLTVGEMNYDVVIVPVLETIRATTLDRLEAFLDKGGRVVFLGGAPKLVDAAPDDRCRALWERGEKIPFERMPLLNALKDIRDVEIRRSSGEVTENLMYQLREEKDCRWLFIAHADAPSNPDIPRGDVLRIKLRGSFDITLYDTLTGEIRPLATEEVGGFTTVLYPFYEHDSALLRLDKRGAVQVEAVRPVLVDSWAEGRTRFTCAVPITLHESNVLLLDMAEFALDDEPYRQTEEILRLDNILRSELGWPLRGGIVAQPWVDRDDSKPRTLRLRFAVHSEEEVTGAELALENADITTVTLNGLPAGPVDGWYVDKCIGKVSLPTIKKGENALELSIPYGRKTDVEVCYLLGDFGVRVNGRECTLTKPVTELYFGDITRQGLPFYGGNLTYHMEAEINSDSFEIAATCYRGHLLRVSVDGEDAGAGRAGTSPALLAHATGAGRAGTLPALLAHATGVIAFSPYRLKVENLVPGKHRIDMTYFGSRVNTFGQLHRNDRYNPWWGPDSWRTTGASWTYEYRFWTQGVLKSPEIF